jgi:HK97 family phage portal protein
MSLIDRLNIIKSAFSKAPEQSITRMVQRMTPVYGEPPSRNTAAWLELYNNNPRMNPIHLIASDVSTSDYAFYNVKDPINKLEAHPMKSLLKKPCPDKTITESMLFYITQVHLLLPAGEAFWIKERNGLDKVTELWPIPPHWVAMTPSRADDVFTIYPSGNMDSTPIRVPARDMVYFKRPDVLNPYLRGIGRAQGINDEIETDEYMAKHAKRFFFNNAIPAMVGMMPNADEIAVDRMRVEWNQKYGGVNNSHKTAWLGWDAKFQVLKETYKEMDFIESRKYLRDSANQHFCIPPELFGILENSNRSTIDAAYYLYTKNVLRKELKFLDDTLNSQLIPDFGGGVYIMHDNVVPEDEEFVLKQTTEGFKNGAVTRNEWRRANGQAEEGPSGDVYHIPLNMIIVPKGSTTIPTPPDQNPQQTPPNSPAPEPAKSKAFDEEKKKRIWMIMDKAATDKEPQFKSTLVKYFNKQQEKAIKGITDGAKAYDPDSMMDWDEEDAELEKDLTPLWISAILASVLLSIRTYDFRIYPEGLSESELISSIAEDFTPNSIKWVKKFGAEAVTNINDTTKEALRKTLTEGLEKGESIPLLTKRVESVYDGAKGYRAERIARTETHNTVQTGSHLTFIEAGVKKEQWITTMDNATRDWHADMNNEVALIGEPFSNGMLYPGDPTAGPEDLCNCRCVTAPVIE